MEVRNVPMTDPLVRPVIEDLAREYLRRYGRLYEDLLDYPAEKFAPPDGAFLVLIEDGQVVASAAFQRHSAGTAEIKRVWTHRDHRRRGLAARLLTELEKEAAGRGYTRLVLSTGPRQPEATRLYLAAGYTALFDATDPPARGPLHFEKPLTGAMSDQCGHPADPGDGSAGGPGLK